MKNKDFWGITENAEGNFHNRFVPPSGMVKNMIYFLSHNDIQDKEFELKIADELSKHQNFLYFTATQSLKTIRKNSGYLSSLVIPYDFENANANLYSITEFVQNISRNVYKDGGYLSVADQKYILAKTINYYYKDQAMQKTMYHMRYELYELYQLMMFYDITLSDKQVQKIALDFSPVETGIFSIYQVYRKIIDALLSYMSTGISCELLVEILGDKPVKVKNKPIDTFTDKQKHYIKERVKEATAIIFEGFLFLNDVQKFILSTAIIEKKTVYFISKQFEENLGNRIFEEGFENIVNSFSVPIKKVHLKRQTNEPETALEHIKCLFPINSKTTIKNAEKLIHDNSINFIHPFINREEELRYVAKSISLELKKAYNGNINELIHILNNDICIVLAIEKEKYEERLSNIFREVGLFIFNQKKIKGTIFEEVDINTFPKVYFNRDDFLATYIKWNSGVSLKYQEKYGLFEKGFDRIDINKFSRPIVSYPIGQFVLEIYRIINEKMNIEGFKRILYSNWRYNADKGQPKWSDFISDFKYLEIYFENQNTILDWCEKVKELILLKSEVEENSLYIYHHLKQVKMESLSFFNNLLGELNEIINRVSKVVGSVDNHLEVLKSVVMKADAILGIDDEMLEFEQVILKKLVSAISDIGRSSIVNNLEAQYFAQNIKAMLTDWENQNQSEQTGELILNVVNLENMKKYKHSYFIMCEANKYPRRYFEIFPFTKDIVEILRNPVYGINIMQETRDFDKRLQLEKYFFKNVLDFTTEKLTVTYCEKEGNSRNRLSIYAEDIVAAFKSDIPYCNPFMEGKHLSINFESRQNKITFEKKDSYLLTELAIFKLCPKLYYHQQQSGDNRGVYLSRLQLKFYAEAILYCDLFKRFMDYNLKNKKVYLKDSTEYLEIIPELFKECCRDNIKHFSFFGKYELEDTIRNVSNKLKGFIENSVQYIKGNTYTVISYTDKNYEGNGYTLTIEHDNRVVDYDKKTWRMSQNRSYLEFLVLKTSDKKTELKHYADMIMALDKNLPDLDRVNLISRIIAKINIQFDSKRFADDGIKRTDDLVNQICNYDFGNAEAMPSGYCTYCRFYDVCMAK